MYLWGFMEVCFGNVLYLAQQLGNPAQRDTDRMKDDAERFSRCASEK